jgi:tight adherence protein C
VSSLYLMLGVAGSFLAATLLGATVHGVVAERRRVLALLRAQVPEVEIRAKELARPFSERALLPILEGLGRAARRVTPIGMREGIARKLVLAGGPAGIDAEKVAALKVFGALGGGTLTLFLAVLAGLHGIFVPVSFAFGGAVGYLIPGAGLGQRAIARQEAIQLALPDVMDLLTISVEAGLGFDAALVHVRRNVPGPLSDEFGRLLQELQLGTSRADAFRHLAQRTDVEELKAFVMAMIQADVFGISIAKVLRAQAKELRIKRRQRAEEIAMKVPTKLLFPLIFFILPAMFVVLIGPAAIHLAQTFFNSRL